MSELTLEREGTTLLRCYPILRFPELSQHKKPQGSPHPTARALPERIPP